VKKGKRSAAAGQAFESRAALIRAFFEEPRSSKAKGGSNAPRNRRDLDFYDVTT